ncbi:hypothetical protein ACN2XU_02575 [Primorskyibacter sp. 2E107]|uniref:hypothetical protein n=1 Tax=Primorskyibacter sp. 2E107 TaxID=3403458 RepID=UPI003AF95637
MGAPRPLSEKMLREAAQVAKQEGVTVKISRGALVYEVSPAKADADKPAGEDWEKAFDA